MGIDTKIKAKKEMVIGDVKMITRKKVVHMLCRGTMTLNQGCRLCYVS